MTSTPETPPTESPSCQTIGGRYEVQELLGRGGMAVVYRVRDSISGRMLALKRLCIPAGSKHPEQAAALFEREFRMLAQLSHPRIIEAYDYSVDAEGLFYTMELLDGRDLRECSPLPWREACALLYDICSSLALLHSRRLVHRDISPRNVRCTHDGKAKLIDFGTMTPMGPSELAVGTPAFVAPEVVHLSTLDARTDLFSLGATLYYALTGRPPYAAYSFAHVLEAWRVKPPAPSSFVDTIPQALDDLVLALLSLEPAMRPRGAFDVMQRLAALSGIENVEPDSVHEAYLATPVMVGREKLMSELRGEMARAFGGRGHCVVIEGAPGLGRSRMLDASVLEAKTRGMIVLRAAASATRGSPFAAARTLALQLLEALPEDAPARAEAEGVAGRLFETAERDANASTSNQQSPVRLRDWSEFGPTPSGLRDALAQWLLGLARDRAIAIAVDDAHGIDDASAGLLAMLARRAHTCRLLVMITAEKGASVALPLPSIFAKHGPTHELRPLSAAETKELLCSVFGDVPNLHLVCDGIYKTSAGNPRVCMDVAQHLVDKGLFRYERGSWSLPSRLDPADLPSSAEEAMRRRLAELSPSSRRLAEAQALASHETFTRDQYALLWPSCADAAGETVDEAISELVSQQVLLSDGRHYWLAHRGWAFALTSPLSDEDRRARHRALVALYEDPLQAATVRHLLDAGLDSLALDKLVELMIVVRESAGLFKGHSSSFEVAATFQRALAAGERLGRAPRELHDIRRWLVNVSVSADDSFYWHNAPVWLAQLESDSGLSLWRTLSAVTDPKERLAQALAGAKERYFATPEKDRVYRPDEAIRFLMHYVVMSIAIGSRNVDSGLIDSLPPLLEPFAATSPVVAAILQNAQATREARCWCRPERARALWLEVIERLQGVSSAELPFIEPLRDACISGVAAMETAMGLPLPAGRAERLEKAPAQAVNVLYLRKASCLQQGDWEGAEHYRRQAELQAMGARARQMFTNSLPVELAAHALADDLTGVKQLIDRIEPLAASSAGWAVYRQLAEGHFQRIRGDLKAASSAFERCIGLCSPLPNDPSRLLSAWLPAVAGQIEVLARLGCNGEARELGEGTLAVCRERDIGVMSHEISRALALAESNCGDFVQAIERLEAVIAEQRAHGVTGLLLGASYEARARLAIAMRDEPAVDAYARLTANEYRHGRGSPLGARYERLMDEARRAVSWTLPKLSEFEEARSGATALQTRSAISSFVTAMMSRADSRDERACCGLRMLCEDLGTRIGFLYLFGEGGLQLAASEGDVAPDGLLELARELIETELEADCHVTRTAGPESTWASRYRDRAMMTGSSDFHPIFLRCAVDGESYCAGVALLGESRAKERTSDSGLLVEAISEHFMRLRDTRGVSIGESG